MTMTLNQKAAMMIRSLMRDLHVSNHIVFPYGDAKSFSSDMLLKALDAEADAIPFYLELHITVAEPDRLTGDFPH